MDLTQLEYFLAVARTEHFANAAAELHVSQSTISMAIARLEEELNVHLFSRYGRRKYLTPTGVVFKNYVDEVMKNLAMAKVEVQLMDKVQQSVVTIASDSIEAIKTAEISLLERSKDFIIQQYLTSTQQVENNLLSQKVDFGFHHGNLSSEEILSVPVLYERIGILVSKKHPFAQRKSVRLEEMANERFIVLYPETGYHDMAQAFFQHAGFTPHIVMEALDMQMIYSAVSHNVGIAFLSDGGWHQHMVLRGPNVFSKATSIIPIENSICHRTFYLSTLKGRQLSQPAWYLYSYFSAYFQEVERNQAEFRKSMDWV